MEWLPVVTGIAAKVQIFVIVEVSVQLLEKMFRFCLQLKCLVNSSGISLVILPIFTV